MKGIVSLLGMLGLALLTSGFAGKFAQAGAWLAPGEPLTGDQLVRLVEPALPAGERFRIDFAQPALPLHNPAETEAALRLLELRYDRGSQRFSGLLHVQLATGEQSVLRLAGTAQVLVEVLVPLRTIAAGERLDAGLLEPVILAEQRLRADTIIDPDMLVGSEARRRLMAGRPIRHGDIQEPRLIRRGDTVELVYRAPGIALTASARALEDGSRGNVVTVANLDSGQRLAALVTGPGQVAVGRRHKALR